MIDPTVQRAIQALRQAKRRIAELEASQTPPPPTRQAPVVIWGFRHTDPFEALTQQQITEDMIWHIAAGRCAREGVRDPSARDEIFAEVKAQVEKYAVSPELIRQRHLALSGALIADALPRVFQEARGAAHQVQIDDKLDFYCDTVGAVFDRFYDREDQPPSDIVHASCTGYRSPSPAQRYVSERGWLNSRVTHSYHMGCYGAFPALRIALGFAASHAALGEQRERVDVVHTEISSLHYDLTDLSPENVIMMTLFSDGFIRYSATLQSGLPTGHRGLAIRALHDVIMPDSLGDMGLEVKPDRFDVRVSVFVPQLIRQGIREFVDTLCAKAGLDFEAERDQLALAIHPGGPIILDYVRDMLGVSEEQMRHSRAVLRERGNMVSATVPHIWQRLLTDDAVPVGAKVLAVAFGPGVTCTGAVLEVVEGGAS